MPAGCISAGPKSVCVGNGQPLACAVILQPLPVSCHFEGYKKALLSRIVSGTVTSELLLLFLTFLLCNAIMHSVSLLSKDGWNACWISHAGNISKWLKISSDFFLGLVALPLWFSNIALWLQNSNEKGSLSLGWT